MFKDRNKPFVLVFGSRDPDGSQHNQGDSLNTLVPGIDGPTSLAAIRNADDDFARIRAKLGELRLLDTTDIIATAVHGFSTISKERRRPRHFRMLPNGPGPDVTSRIVTSNPARNELVTVINMQMVGATRYFDAAGFPGRTVGRPNAPRPGETTQSN